LVFDSPHSGIAYPPDFVPAATPPQIATTWDAYVDELFAGVTQAGAVLLAANFPRAYIDANRAEADIDPELLAGPWPRPIALSEHAGRGMGLIRRLALPGVPMYARRLEVSEVEWRIERYFRPYRRTLEELIEAAWRRHGTVWHFNCHSMKSRGNAMNVDAGAARADLVIGDRGGTSADPELTRWVAAHFTQLGYHVKINDPYRGADIVRAHGEPARRRHSIQIEINRALYLEEATVERGRRFAELRGHLAGFAEAAAGELRSGRAGRGQP
jgi:N-formylglutamate deformylase